MPLYPYEYRHDESQGLGTIVAKDKSAAEEKLRKNLTANDTKKNKVTNLVIEVGEPVEEE